MLIYRILEVVLGAFKIYLRGARTGPAGSAAAGPMFLFKRHNYQSEIFHKSNTHVLTQ